MRRSGRNGPHHRYIGVLVAGVAVWVVSDDYPNREPLVVAVGALTALFAFATVWLYYHGTGAALALAGLLVALGGVCWPGGCRVVICSSGDSSRCWARCSRSTTSSSTPSASGRRWTRCFVLLSFR